VVERLNHHTWGAYYSWVDLGMGQNPVQLTSRKRGSDGHHVAMWMRTQFRGLLLCRRKMAKWFQRHMKLYWDDKLIAIRWIVCAWNRFPAQQN
jgi:hypothetical protein